MAMDQEIHELQPVTQMAMLDVSSVRDSGMQALVLLARSLGWNVLQKHNNPVVVTSPEGIQKRLPTNTSVRQSVFQTTLSGIILHSSLEPTMELVEQIIRSVKPNREQANRLRLAVGETPQQHRERIEQHEAPVPEPRNTPLTQTPVITWEDPPTEATDTPVPAASPRVRLAGSAPGRPYGGGDHGEIVDQHAFVARSRQRRKDGSYYVYDSESSDERTWSDGFVDYVCKVCHGGFASAKAVGSHRQVHIKNGEVQHRSQTEVMSGSLRTVTPATPVAATPPEEPEVVEVVEVDADEALTTDAVDVLQQIRDLVMPNVISELDRLHAENNFLRERNEKLTSDLQALKSLIGELG